MVRHAVSLFLPSCHQGRRAPEAARGRAGTPGEAPRPCLPPPPPSQERAEGMDFFSAESKNCTYNRWQETGCELANVSLFNWPPACQGRKLSLEQVGWFQAAQEQDQDARWRNSVSDRGNGAARILSLGGIFPPDCFSFTVYQPAFNILFLQECAVCARLCVRATQQ